MTQRFDPADPAGPAFRSAVGAQLAGFLGQRRVELAQIGPELDHLMTLADAFTDGGKRLRPAICWWSWIAAGGRQASARAEHQADAVLHAASSLDLLHVSALVHDDVMDGSDTRRGVPSAHRSLETRHRAANGRGSAESFGRSGAILLGDLLLVWSMQMFRESNLPSGPADHLLEQMRTEVTAGQYLDVLAQTMTPANHAEALALASRVVEFKSARYTVARPAQIGAALAGAAPEVIAGLGAFGSPLGRAFQYRDDLLGVFGDPDRTGKPAGDDLREGKRTVLIAHALAEAPPDQAAYLESMLGRADLTRTEIDQARQIIVESGAQRRVEETIDAALDEALTALDRVALSDEGRTALVALAHACVDRSA